MPHSEFSISLHLNFYFSPVYEGLGGFSLFFLTLFTEILVGGSVSRTTKPRRQQRFIQVWMHLSASLELPQPTAQQDTHTITDPGEDQGTEHRQG